MAQEADGSELPGRIVSRRRPANDDDRLPRGSTPADSLISPKLWKHAVVAALAVIAWLAVLIVGVRADRAQAGLEGIVGLAAGKLSTFFSTVMLLTAGQLAFINLWYRSRSRKDFNGSYKLWFWTALAWLSICAVQATGAHWMAADAVLAGRPFAVWNGRMIVWLIPAAITFVTLYSLLRREMRDCRESLWTLRLTGIAALGNALTLLFGPFVLNAQQQLVVDSGLAMGWHLLLALSMLLHARYAIHVSNEPPRSEIRRWNWLGIFSLFARSGRGAAKGGKAASGKASTGEPKGKRSTVRKKRRTSSRKAAARTSPSEIDEELNTEAESESESFEEDVEDEVDAPEAPQPVKGATPNTPVRRVDPPQPVGQAKPHFAASAAHSGDEEAADREWSDDETGDEDDSGRGLSKKERRRMKKLQRQQSRTVR